MVVDQYLVFYRDNDEIKTVEVHRVLRGAWNLPQYLESVSYTHLGRLIRMLWALGPFPIMMSSA